MISKIQFGQLGEDIACRYLVDKGWKIIERNFRKSWGELDIIAKSPDKTLVFVEVKTVRQNLSQAIPQNSLLVTRLQSGEELGRCIEPEMQMTSAKIRKLKRAASLYAGHCPELINNTKGWRIDALALVLRLAPGSNFGEVPLTDIYKNCVIRYYENV